MRNFFNLEIFDARFNFFRDLLVVLQRVIVLAMLDCHRSRVVDLRDGPSAAFQATAERALPVDDSTRGVVSLEDVIVDQKSFVAHSGVEVHCLQADAT